MGHVLTVAQRREGRYLKNAMNVCNATGIKKIRKAAIVRALRGELMALARRKWGSMPNDMCGDDVLPLLRPL